MSNSDRWSTASSDSDLSSIYSAGNYNREFSRTPVVLVCFETRVVTIFVARQPFETLLFLWFSPSYVLNHSYLKEKADGKDWELRILSTYYTRKLRFCTVRLNWFFVRYLLSASIVECQEMAEAIPLFSSSIRSPLVWLNYPCNKLSFPKSVE